MCAWLCGPCAGDRGSAPLLYPLRYDWNHKEQVFKYSASYGYAYSYEVPNGSANEVYMLADSRMYEMKREHHESGQEVINHA